MDINVRAVLVCILVTTTNLIFPLRLACYEMRSLERRFKLLQRSVLRSVIRRRTPKH